VQEAEAAARRSRFERRLTFFVRHEVDESVRVLDALIFQCKRRLLRCRRQYDVVRCEAIRVLVFLGDLHESIQQVLTLYLVLLVKFLAMLELLADSCVKYWVLLDLGELLVHRYHDSIILNLGLDAGGIALPIIIFIFNIEAGFRHLQVICLDTLEEFHFFLSDTTGQKRGAVLFRQMADLQNILLQHFASPLRIDREAHHLLAFLLEVV
jgi:hypothetical protein